MPALGVLREAKACASVVFWSPCQRDSHLMEKLRERDIDPNIPKSECVSALATQPVDILLDLRTCLFNHAAEKSLVTPGDELVGRRLTRSGKTLNLMKNCLMISGFLFNALKGVR